MWNHLTDGLFQQKHSKTALWLLVHCFPWPPCKDCLFKRHPSLLGKWIHILCIDLHCGISTTRLELCEKSGDKNVHRLSAPSCLTFQPQREHLGNLLLFHQFCLFFFPRCFILSRQDLTTKCQGKLYGFWGSAPGRQHEMQLWHFREGLSVHCLIWRGDLWGGPLLHILIGQC